MSDHSRTNDGLPSGTLSLSHQEYVTSTVIQLLEECKFADWLLGVRRNLTIYIIHSHQSSTPGTATGNCIKNSSPRKLHADRLLPSPLKTASIILPKLLLPSKQSDAITLKHVSAATISTSLGMSFFEVRLRRCYPKNSKWLGVFLPNYYPLYWNRWMSFSHHRVISCSSV